MFYFLLQGHSVLIQSAIIFLFSIILSSMTAPLLVAYLRKKKLGQVVRELGPESHYHKSGTPTMGGLIFVIVPVITVILFLPLNNLTIWTILFAFLSLALLGFLDDYLKLIKQNHYGIGAKQKIAFQLLASILIGLGVYYTVGSQLYLPLVKTPIYNLTWLFIPFCILLVISWSNAINLTDGLDGFATGLSILVAIPLIITGFLESNRHNHTFLPFFPYGDIISLFLLAVVGSLFVFLWFNGSPAQIFMGDTGSLALGGLFAVCSLLLKVEFFFAYIGILFILENISVIIQVFYYKKTGKRFFKMAPLHHHFEQKNIPETKIVLRSWIIQTLIILSALLILFYKQF